MKKPYKNIIFSDKQCKECNKWIKMNVIVRKPSAKLCFDCHVKKENKRGHYIKGRDTIALKTDFQPGNYVYFYSKNKGTVPAVIEKIGKKRILIAGNFPEQNRKAWVLPVNCELQANAEN